MRKKVLFDYNERFTDRGDFYYKKIAEVLRPIFAEAEGDNVKLRELAHAIALTANMLEVELILARDVTKLRVATYGTGVVPPSAPSIHQR